MMGERTVMQESIRDQPVSQCNQPARVVSKLDVRLKSIDHRIYQRNEPIAPVIQWIEAQRGSDQAFEP